MGKNNKSKYFETFFNYLEKAVTDKDMKMPFKAVQKIYLLSLKDFLDKRISTNVFSSIATSLYYDLNKPSAFNTNSNMQALGHMLDIASELEWNLKNKDENYNNRLSEDIKRYFEDNKDLLLKK